MENVAFESGLATADGVVTAYNADPVTGIFSGEVQEPVTKGVGLPAWCTLTAPPFVSEGENRVARLATDGWEVVDDLRGQTAYEKATGKAVTVSAVGPLAEALTLVAPVSVFDTWTGTAWVTDTVAQKAAQEKEAESLRTQKLAEVNRVTQTWQTQLALGMLSDTNRAKLIEWMRYADALQAVDVTLAPYVIWPDRPAA